MILSDLSLEPAFATLEGGIELHRTGDYLGALQIYQQLLLLNPRHADALHLSGEALFRLGRRKEALDHLNLAISIAQHQFYFNTRANIFLDMGLLHEAQEDYKRALKHDQQYPEAYVGLSAVYRQQGKIRLAREAAAKSISLTPNSPAAWNNAAAIDMEQGQFDAAIDQFNKAIELDCECLPAYKNIGKIRVNQNYWDLALSPLEHAAKNAQDLEVQCLLARAYRLHRRFEEATEALLRALRGWSIDERRKAIEQNDTIETLYAVCSELDGVLGRHTEATELYALALEALPQHELFLNNMGTSKFHAGDYAAAIGILKQALAINPNQILARCNLGVNYIMTNDPDAAIVEFERCLEIDPMSSAALGWLIAEKCNIASWVGLPDIRERIKVNLDDNTKNDAINSFILLSNYDDPNQLLRWTRKASQQMFDPLGITSFNVSVKGRAGRRIRLAYFCFDIRNHPVAHLTAEMFGLHDKSKFEVFIYSYGPDDGHPVRARIASSVEHFVDVQTDSIKKIAERIRDDEIDILVDLSGNTRGAKPQLMAYRAAAVQVMWLGFIGTTGSSYYDYVIGDQFVIPDGFDQHYEEKVLRLPNTFQVTDSKRRTSTKVITRADSRLPEDAFVFCDFNQSFKIQPEMFEVWCRIIKAVPNSVLWLLQGHPSFERNLRIEWAKQGLDDSRLVMSGRVPVEEHLARVGLADLFIDTYPCGSGATANDVLWMGLPLLSLAGGTMVSRMAGSLLNAVGAPELVTHSYAEYEQKAVYLATHLDELAAIRNRMKDARATCPLFDTKRFVRNLDRGFEEVSLLARAGLAPKAITVVEDPQ
jgi:protein O-GlcNAc transferase